MAEFRGGKFGSASFGAGIATGPDGNVWFTLRGDNALARITPAGAVTEFTAGMGTGAAPSAMVAGPDGSMWFSEFNGNRLGRIATGFDPTAKHALLAGTGQVGLPLSCGGDVWGPMTSPSLTWERNGAAISGQTSSTYVPSSADIGRTLTCTSHAVLPGMTVPLAARSNAVKAVAAPVAPLVALFAPGVVAARSGLVARAP